MGRIKKVAYRAPRPACPSDTRPCMFKIGHGSAALIVCDSGCPGPQGFAPTIQSSKSAILLICLGSLL